MTAHPAQLPIAAYTPFQVAPGHESAFDDLAVALDLGLLDPSHSGHVADTPRGWEVTGHGLELLAARGWNGLAERQARLIGRVVACPDWCTAPHPRRQLAAAEVTHTATEHTGPGGYIGISSTDHEDGTSTGPTIEVYASDAHSWTADELRQAARALTATADAYQAMVSDAP